MKDSLFYKRCLSFEQPARKFHGAIKNALKHVRRNLNLKR